MLGQGGQDDPDVTVEMLLARGPRAGMVVDASALDPGAIAFSGGVVDADHQTLGLEQRTDNIDNDRDGHVVDLSANSANRAVALAEVVGNAGGAEPGSDGAAVSGEENA